MSRIGERPYRGDEDFAAVRSLLLAAFPITPPGLNWEIRRWEGWRFYHESGELITEDPIRVWETEGRVVAIVHGDGGGDPVLQVHPDFRDLEDAMFSWAESAFAGDGPERLSTHVFDHDLARARLLRRRGWTPADDGEVSYRMRFGRGRLSSRTIDEGYTMRVIRSGDAADCDRLAALLNDAFGRTGHTGAEFAAFAGAAPSYRDDLHLVAVAGDGSFAAHVGITYDPVNRHGIVEPVCTSRDARRRGLAHALLLDGMGRARSLGARTMEVGTGRAAAARAFYEDIGFTEIYEGRFWRWPAAAA